MWWTQPIRRGFRTLLPANLLDVLVRATSIVEVGGVSGQGATRGRNFEHTFYDICEAGGVQLSETAGSRTLAGDTSASHFAHEIDAASRTVSLVTMWELKHLTSLLPKNELLVFNGKGLDYLYGCREITAKTPIVRFLLSGGNVRDECRYFAVLWGINLIEPGRLPLVLLYESVARGAADCLRPADNDAISAIIPWACRPLQTVVQDLAKWTKEPSAMQRFGPSAIRWAKEAVDIQEQLGAIVSDYLEEESPHWIDDVAEETWNSVGGW